jgi:uncharacterized protein
MIHILVHVGEVDQRAVGLEEPVESATNTGFQLLELGCISRQDRAMTQLKERLRADLNTAMRERDKVRLRTLRLALTSITNEEVSGESPRDLSDDEIVKVLTREAKKRREAAEAFESAGRAEQAAAERAEGDVLASYLPAQLTDDELASLVAVVITETGASGMPAMGQVMKAVTPRIAGRADGARVAAEVRRQLAAAG